MAFSETSGNPDVPLPDTTENATEDAVVFVQRYRCGLPEPAPDIPMRISDEFVGLTLIEVIACAARAVPGFKSFHVLP